MAGDFGKAVLFHNLVLEAVDTAVANIGNFAAAFANNMMVVSAGKFVVGLVFF